MTNTQLKGKSLRDVIRSRYLYCINPKTGRIIRNHWARQAGIARLKGAEIGLMVKGVFTNLTSRKVIPLIKPYMLKARAKKVLTGK